MRQRGRGDKPHIASGDLYLLVAGKGRWGKMESRGRTHATEERGGEGRERGGEDTGKRFAPDTELGQTGTEGQAVDPHNTRTGAAAHH